MKLWRRQQSLLYALHPARIPASGADWRYTLGLGGLTVLAVLVTALSGFLLSLYYAPVPDGARASVIYIQDIAAYGALMRGLHFWAAQVAVVTATLHMARIVFTAAYRPPRDFNWLLGLALLALLLLWDFSGYVLRWDAAATGALTAGTALVREIPRWGEALYLLLTGDGEIGASALLRFYAWHVMGLTFAGGGGIVYHLWRLRKDGGISRPALADPRQRAYVSRDTLFATEAIASAGALAVLIALALLLPVEIGPAAQAGELRAPWIFLWVQALLRVLPPFAAGIGAPLVLLSGLALMPWLDRRGPGRAVWFARERRTPQVAFALAAAVVILLSLGECLR